MDRPMAEATAPPLIDEAGAEDRAGRLADVLGDVLDDPSIGGYGAPATDVGEPRFA